MTTLTQNIKRMLTAFADADAGEYLTLSQKARVLNRSAQTIAPAPAAPAQTRPAAAHRQVALYMGSELPVEVMRYVAQTCARLKHDLTVLTFQPESGARAQLAAYADMLAGAGVAMQLVVLSGEPLAGLARYLRRHPEVAFLACNETGYLGRGLLNGTQRQDGLPVPVVLVAAHGEAVQRVDAATERVEGAVRAA